MDATVTPLPIPDITPPVTKIYLTKDIAYRDYTKGKSLSNVNASLTILSLTPLRELGVPSI